MRTRLAWLLPLGLAVGCASTQPMRQVALDEGCAASIEQLAVNPAFVPDPAQPKLKPKQRMLIENLFILSLEMLWPMLKLEMLLVLLLKMPYTTFLNRLLWRHKRKRRLKRKPKPTRKHRPLLKRKQPKRKHRPLPKRKQPKLKPLLLTELGLALAYTTRHIIPSRA